MASFADIASLAVAISDLKVVESVINASNAADLESGDVRTPSGIIEKPQFGPETVLHPTPRIDPRVVFQPIEFTTRTDSVELSSQAQTAHSSQIAPMQPKVIVESEQHAPATPSPIQPPWKVLFWKTPIPPPLHIKQVVYQTDVISKGSLLDLFI